MAFHEYGKTQKVRRNEHVDIHVRPLTLNADDPDESKHVKAIEIREFIKNGEVYGHGLVVPLAIVGNLSSALQTLAPEEDA